MFFFINLEFNVGLLDVKEQPKFYLAAEKWDIRWTSIYVKGFSCVSFFVSVKFET